MPKMWLARWLPPWGSYSLSEEEPVPNENGSFDYDGAEMLWPVAHFERQFLARLAPGQCREVYIPDNIFGDDR